MSQWAREDKTFADLGLPLWISNTAAKLNMHHPTEIQVQCIPAAMERKNLIGSARTGSGKTLAFGMPILAHLSKDPFGVFALIITPVRELAFQIRDQLHAVGEGISVNVQVVVGGQGIIDQQTALQKRPHVVVATPGRLADLFKQDPRLSHCFRNLKVLVLDEADQLLDETFTQPLADIFAHVPAKRQTLLFSATITSAIEKLRERFADVGEMLLMDANPSDTSVPQLVQEYLFMPESVRITYLHHLLKNDFHEKTCMIFAPTVELVQEIHSLLETLGFQSTCLHSLQLQRARLASLGKFKSGKSTILVATDVASRGLDIPTCEVVINFGLPKFVDTYIHRIGRTARAGRQGLAVSLISKRDVRMVAPTEERIGKKLVERAGVVEDEVLKLLNKTTKAQQKAILMLSETGFEDKLREFHARKEDRKIAGKQRRENARASAKKAKKE